MEISIKQEFKSLIPPLSPEEFAQLEKNCLAEGIREKILVWKGLIIDGHNRFEIATRWGLDFQTQEKHFENESDVKAWMITNQFGRRNLSNYQRSVLALQLESVFKEKAKEKQKGGQGGVLLSQKSDEAKQEVSTKKELAKVANVSHDTIAKVKKIEEAAPEEVKQKLRTGEVSINQVYTDIKKAEKKEARKTEIENQIKDIEEGKLPELTGTFEVIAIDPPWPYGREYDPETSRVANPYPEMSIEAIKAIELPLAKDSIVFLWTTHAFLKDAFDILEHWGCNYKATMVWDKERMGMGATVRMQCEFCLIGFKGKPYFNGSAERDIIRETRRQHSRKPDAFFDFVDRATLGRKLEYFSREQRTNWTTYGNETEKF
jgi:N6-adenosine-specific RNA methylase IME4